MRTTFNPSSMNKALFSVQDPFGNTVLIPEDLCSLNSIQFDEIFDDAASVISQPAYVILLDEACFFFRSIGWNNTLLIETEYQGAQWTAVRCINNPAEKYISSLLKKGKLVSFR